MTADGQLASALAICIAAGVAALALTLPGKSPEGLVVGLGLTVAAMMTWTHYQQPMYVWAVKAILGLVLLVWTLPWWSEWRLLPRLGGFWLSVPIWAFGVVSALAVGRFTIAGHRIVYGGYALVVLLVLVQAWWRRRHDPSVGLVAALLLAHAMLLLAGADNVFAGVHHVPANPWARRMEGRFWGGPLLVYHPNSIAFTGMIAAMRVAPDAAFRKWQRVGVLAVASLLLVLTKSRTSMFVAGVAAACWFVVVLLRSDRIRSEPILLFTAPPYRRLLGQALLPIVLVGLVVAASGGTSLMLTTRYPKLPPAGARAQSPPAGRAGLDVDGVSSGRIRVWWLIFEEWRSDSRPEQIFGNADKARGDILRYKWDFAKGPAPAWYGRQPKLTADNVLVAALRRSGVVGVAAALLGLVLVVWRTVRWDAPVWIIVTTMGVLATLMTRDELLDTSPGWALVVACEVLMLARRRGDVIPDAGTGTVDDASSAGVCVEIAGR